MSFDQTSNPQYSEYIALSRYARFRDDLGRRELWHETVDRLATFWEQKFPDLRDVIRKKLQPAILNLEVMPSMRSLMTAGEALERCNVAAYNCSYVAIEHPRDFDEILYILMNGTGVGYSVERQYVNKLPEVAESHHESDTVIMVADSKIGWAKALKQLLSLLWNGEVPKWDLSKVRPAGARLKTFGGRASGPDPLNDLFRFCVSLFKKAAGRKLSSIECHDLVCKIADIVVVGGVRRSALISLSNLSDDRMRLAKSGQWWIDNPQRALANNSYVADEKPDFEIFLEEWMSLYKSRSGERGIFSRTASKRQAEKTGRREPSDFGTNPCCVTGDTNIHTLEYGVISIKEAIDIFDKGNEISVLSYDENLHIPVMSKVEAAQPTRKNAELIELTIETQYDDKVLRLTPDHQVYTENRGYVRADEITEEDELVISFAKTKFNGKLKARRIVSNEDTYDIQTEKHNFFANDVLVHNSEIILRNKQFCNLSEVVIRSTDTLDDLKRKVEIATILGTFQSTLTNFKYLRSKWKENTEEERLLGVSLTGIFDHPVMSDENNPDLKVWLSELRELAVNVNKEWAEKIGVEQSTAITAVKPSGCTTLNTEVKTNRGIMSMADIFAEFSTVENIFELAPGTWVDLNDELFVYDENDDLQKVTKLFVNGMSEVYEIEDEFGNNYKFTPNHKLKTIDGWKMVKDIQEGDDIISFT